MNAFSQEGRTVSGKVVDTDGNSLIGVQVVVEGTTRGTTTDVEGEFSLSVAETMPQTLVVSFMGMITEEVDIEGADYVEVTLRDDVHMLEDVIVVGYARQQKESVVGAISQTTGAVLERSSGGGSSVGAALTGNIPGLITMQRTGMPGEEDPLIRIRGQSTWNDADPLVLVDGVERSLNDVDIQSVESISVLKDASATAVFGVKGANGVILVTTKRGVEGEAQIQISSQASMKMPSKIPLIFDAYDASMVRNDAIERELGVLPGVWDGIMPQEDIEKYRTLEPGDREYLLYPNVDWQDETFEDYAFSNNHNVSISGGTPSVRYYTALDYTYEGDVHQIRENNKGYTPGYAYNRMNLRSNLDFQLTESTILKTNLFGSHGVKQDTWRDGWYEDIFWAGAYNNPPDAMHIKYNDDYWGYYAPELVGVINSPQILSNSGIRNTKTTAINTDFILEQDLDMLIEGLDVNARFSMDNRYVSQGGIQDNAGVHEMWMDPDPSLYDPDPVQDSLNRVRLSNVYGQNRFDHTIGEWNRVSDGMINNQTRRDIYYQAQINYAKQIDVHNITAMTLFSREQRAGGSEFPHYREDWVFRTTYNYDRRYLTELNFSYNGSEKWGTDYRFDFFPSVALGWTPSNESFMEDIEWLELLRFRGSYGFVGNDAIPGRWLYMTQWGRGGQSRLGSGFDTESPYVWYTEEVMGNPDLHWETVEKKNIGIEFEFFYGAISGSIDLFDDYRDNILIQGGDRAVLDYVGGTPPTANLGEVESRGYEIELNFDYRFTNDFRVWVGGNTTHAKEEVIFRDDPQLLPDYQKQEGYQIGQTRSHLLGDFVNTFDEIYGTTQWTNDDAYKLPGDYNVIDFNADGIIDGYDSAPYGYPERPQNTYNLNMGLDYKGLSLFVQFYGVNNATRYVPMQAFNRQWNIFYDHGELWSKDNPDADSYLPRYSATHGYQGHFHLHDASYFRLKNAEISYSFESESLDRMGISSLRVFMNGNNLLLWTDMPDDRESNLDLGGSNYPMVRRVSFGINVTL